MKSKKFGDFSKEDIEARIRIWLLNGVTFREIEDRLNWLGVNLNYEDILRISRETK